MEKKVLWIREIASLLKFFLQVEVLSSCKIESVQDFLIKLDMKPCMHLVEISIFLLNHVIIRLTKIMNNLLKRLKIRNLFLCV